MPICLHICHFWLLSRYNLRVITAMMGVDGISEVGPKLHIHKNRITGKGTRLTGQKLDTNAHPVSQNSNITNILLHNLRCIRGLSCRQQGRETWSPSGTCTDWKMST